MERERLGSRLGFILLSAGCAIGCGNVWKFPWMCGQYGGGGFVLIYILCLLLLGLPVMTMEFAVGRAAQASPIHMYQKLERKGQKWHLHGYVAFFGNIALMAFYTVVTGWIIYYFVRFLTGRTEDLGFVTMITNPGVNVTYLAVTVSGRRYILQKINHHTFRDVAGLMENITSVTEFLRTKTDDPRSVLTLVKTADGASYLHAQEGYWRVYDFVEDTICLQQPETDEDFYQSAVGFGTFQQLLAEFPAEKLHETIPNFHNTPDRYRAFLETLERDPMRRAAQVQPEIEFALARQSEMAALQTALKAGELPLRVTHNDTKLNNVLLDAKTRKALCVIDLDTVMPGSSLYDFGDSIRFGAATAAEDERDLSRMEMSLERFHVFTRGYVRSCPGLTQKELELLPLGAKTMTMECGVRFLTDYLDGDHYFAVHRDGQNLDRARTQFRLVADMEKKWNEMQKIVAEEANKER